MSEAGLSDHAKSYGVERRLDILLEAILKSWPPGVDKVFIRGVAMTRDELAAKVEETRSIWKRVREAKALIRQFANDKPQHKAVANQLLDDAKVSLASHVGLESETLTAFGFAPKRRRRKLTSEQEALRVAKLRETRKARGTMGRRQREKIKFNGEVSVFIEPDGTSYVGKPYKVLPVETVPPPVTSAGGAAPASSEPPSAAPSPSGPQAQARGPSSAVAIVVGVSDGPVTPPTAASSSPSSSSAISDRDTKAASSSEIQGASANGSAQPNEPPPRG